MILFVCKMMVRFISGRKLSSVAVNGRFCFVFIVLFIVSNLILWKYVMMRRVFGLINLVMSLFGLIFCVNFIVFERNVLNSVENLKILLSGKVLKV